MPDSFQSFFYQFAFSPSVCEHTHFSISSSTFNIVSPLKFIVLKVYRVSHCILIFISLGKYLLKVEDFSNVFWPLYVIFYEVFIQNTLSIIYIVPFLMACFSNSGLLMNRSFLILLSLFPLLSLCLAHCFDKAGLSSSREVFFCVDFRGFIARLFDWKLITLLQLIFVLWVGFMFARVCRNLGPWPGIRPVPPAVEEQNLNYWTGREVLSSHFNLSLFWCFLCYLPSFPTS